MFANKLKNNRPRFVVIRGMVSYLILMGVWAFYPMIQRGDLTRNPNENFDAEPRATKVETEKPAPLASQGTRSRVEAGLMIPLPATTIESFVQMQND